MPRSGHLKLVVSSTELQGEEIGAAAEATCFTQHQQTHFERSRGDEDILSIIFGHLVDFFVQQHIYVGDRTVEMDTLASCGALSQRRSEEQGCSETKSTIQREKDKGVFKCHTIQPHGRTSSCDDCQGISL